MIVAGKRKVRNDVIEITSSKTSEFKVGDRYFVYSMYFEGNDDKAKTIDVVKMNDTTRSDEGKRIRIRCNGRVTWKIVGSFNLEQMNVCSFSGIALDDETIGEKDIPCEEYGNVDYNVE